MTPEFGSCIFYVSRQSFLEPSSLLPRSNLTLHCRFSRWDNLRRDCRHETRQPNQNPSSCSGKSSAKLAGRLTPQSTRPVTFARHICQMHRLMCLVCWGCNVPFVRHGCWDSKSLAKSSHVATVASGQNAWKYCGNRWHFPESPAVLQQCSIINQQQWQVNMLRILGQTQQKQTGSNIQQQYQVSTIQMQPQFKCQKAGQKWFRHAELANSSRTSVRHPTDT